MTVRHLASHALHADIEYLHLLSRRCSALWMRRTSCQLVSSILELSEVRKYSLCDCVNIHTRNSFLELCPMVVLFSLLQTLVGSWLDTVVQLFYCGYCSMCGWICSQLEFSCVAVVSVLSPSAPEVFHISQTQLPYGHEALRLHDGEVTCVTGTNRVSYIYTMQRGLPW